MKIGEFIRKYNITDTAPLKSWWIKGVKWRDMNVNFYTLLCFCDLWAFNYSYQSWYNAGNEGSMGDFLEAEPTDKQIADFMKSDKEFITFPKQKGVRK